MARIGSARLASALIRDGLIDEHRITVNPPLLGRGQPLFGDLNGPLVLRLVNAGRFVTGTYCSVTLPRGNEAEALARL